MTIISAGEIQLSAEYLKTIIFRPPSQISWIKYHKIRDTITKSVIAQNSGFLLNNGDWECDCQFRSDSQ